MPPPSSQRPAAPATEGVPLDLLLTGLTECGALPVAEVQALKARATPADRQNCVPLAKELVKARKLTKYQATLILQGKGRELTLDNYLVLDKLGEGGMGMVFKARHRKLGQVVALKVLSPAVTSKPTAVKRFLREVRAVSQLQHPNIVAASDAGEDKGTHFLVMEFVEGTDLSKLVKQQGPVPAERAVDYVVQAARGLAHAHAAGIIHRDIKPSNLLLDGRGVVKVLDLGLARQTGDDDDSATQELTKTGAILGTSDYIAPEQALNSRNANRGSDVYSLGCTLFYLLTGQTMYGGQTVMEKLMAHRDAPIPPLPGASAALQAAYRRMVAKKPEERFASMDEAIAALEASLRPEAATPSAPRWPRSLLLGTAVGALIGVVLLLVPLLLWFGSSPRPTVAGGSTGSAVVSTGPGNVVPTGAVDDPARWRNAINLLAVADPARDRTSGSWRLDGGNLVCTAVPGAKYLLPYQPPEEYDLRVEYTRLTGKHHVQFLLSSAGRQFAWEIGNDLFGFNAVDGRERYTSVGAGKPGLENGRRLSSIIQVRKQGVKAYTNGALVSELAANYQNVGPPAYWHWAPGAALGVGSWLSETSFHRIEVLEITGKGALGRSQQPRPSQPPADGVHDAARWQKAIDLLRLVETSQDALSGVWKKNQAGVTSDKSAAAKLLLPYQPPEEYDFRVVFTRHEGDHAISQVLSKGGRCFSWDMSVFPNKAFTFNTVAGRANNNATTVPGKELANGERHTSIVQVRNTGLAAYVDGVLIREYKTDYRELGEPFPWKWPANTGLGLGSWASLTTFHAADILEVTGKGTPTRP